MTKATNRRLTVVALKEGGKHTNKEIAQKVGMCVRGVQLVMQRWRERGDVGVKKRRVRGRAERERKKDLLVRLIQRFPRGSADFLASELGKRRVVLSPRQTSRWRRELGFRPLKAPQVPILSEKNRRLREEFAEKNEDEEWKTTIFSDECYFQLHADFRPVWARFGSAVPTVAAPNRSIKVMVWGAIGKGFKSKLVIFPKGTKINQNVYQKMFLENHLIEDFLGKFGADLCFQQDNAPAHRALTTLSFLESWSPETLKHPPQSPDFNPIELIWGIMKKRINLENPTDRDSLIVAIQKTWNHLTLSEIRRCIDRLKSVTRRVREAKGKRVYNL